MGDWVYYPALLAPEVIRDVVMSSKQIREAKELDDYLQRRLKPRTTKIAQYLQTRDSRFFNSLILGVFGGLPTWLELDISAVLRKNNIDDVAAIQESLGVMLFSGKEKVFAIDGQHRVEGIKKALQQNPNCLSNEQVPVVLVAHQDDAAGKVRTRRLFSDINKNAVRVSDGDKVIIDEDELPAIVARRVYAGYPGFNGGQEIAITEKKEQLSQDDVDRFTSLLGLYTVCRVLQPLYKKRLKKDETMEARIDRGKVLVSKFFDFIFEHVPSLKAYSKGQATLGSRRSGNKDVFFRPVGLEILAKWYVRYAQLDKLTKLAKGLGEVQFDNPGGMFDGIVWQGGRLKVSGKEKRAAVDLLLYLLGDLSDDKEDALREVLRQVRNDDQYDLPPKAAYRK